MDNERNLNLEAQPPRKLCRSRSNRVIAGVCGGLGEFFGIDPVVVRLIWVAAFFLGGAGLLAYIICALVIPEAPFGVTAPPLPYHHATPGTVGVVIAVILIGAGILALFSNIFGWSIWSWFWKILVPVLLIAVGLFLILRLRKR
ncbi:MAG: PspC domain-containing protein [bacterium]